MVDQARWQSGYAAACKAADAGSIPTLASNQLTHGPGGGIGRRYGLKIRCPKGRAGSSPAPGTIQDNLVISFARNNSFVIVLYNKKQLKLICLVILYQDFFNEKNLPIITLSIVFVSSLER